MQQIFERWMAWVASLPAAPKAFYYAVEAAILSAIGIFGSSLYVALTNNQPFDWHAQIHTLEISVIIGALKAFLDLLKAAGVQIPFF